MTILSVIVCTRNRAQQLKKCLARLGSLSAPEHVSVEIVVVDNGSDDDTEAVIAAAARASPLPVRYVCEPCPGIARARNRGLRMARGDLLAFTDDDCLPADDWLNALAAAFHDRPDVDLLGGRVQLHDPGDRRVTVKTQPDREVLASARGLDGFVHGCNLALRRTVVGGVGGFDVRFGAGTAIGAGEDTDFIYRAFLAGFGVAYEPSVVVAHAHGRQSEAAEDRLRRRYRIAIGALQTKWLLRGDRGMRAWMAYDLARHLRAAVAAWRSPVRVRRALARASHHVQGAVRFVLAAVRARGDCLGLGFAERAEGDLPASGRP
jgi:GT2 family glycosyltransferase